MLDLTDAVTLSQLGLTHADLVRDDCGLTQELGETAHRHGIQATRTPPATGTDDVLVIFTENLAGVHEVVPAVREATAQR